MTAISDSIIRHIQIQDNSDLAIIIRTALEEFGANKPGTVYFDKATDNMFELFQQKGAAYFIAEKDKKILGGAGIFPTEGLAADTVELVKIYLSADARGKGLGKVLMQYCIECAKNNKYKKLYLETMPELVSAIPLYQKFGFEFLNKPMGNSGHTACQLWMMKVL